MTIETFINWIGIFGVVVFAVSGALVAARKNMDPVGFLLLGTITAIGGGTVRDIILNRPVFWLADPSQLVIALVTSLFAYLFVSIAASFEKQKWVAWSDALGLAAFAVQGSFIALSMNSHPIVVIIMGTMTAVGGGLIRDILSSERPMIFRGQLYAIAAMSGAVAVVALHGFGMSDSLTAIAGFVIALATRGAAMVFNIRSGPPGEWFTVGKVPPPSDDRDGSN
ncbi:MAG: trimeric intracellular cation channel family protein [Verrucomicrobiales bacterium]